MLDVRFDRLSGWVPRPKLHRRAGHRGPRHVRQPAARNACPGHVDAGLPGGGDGVTAPRRSLNAYAEAAAN